MSDYINKIRQYSLTRDNTFFDTFIIATISLSFAMSDWMLGLFTFTEIILFFILTLLLLSKRIIITNKQIKIISFIIFGLSLHTLYHYLYTDDFILKVSTYALIKLLFYLFVSMVILNLIRPKKAKKFLLINNYVAIIIGLLGVYIALAVYSEMYLDFNIPYENLLHFTRVDGHLFRANIPIVRMKSIFKEPAHLGFYLNTILMMNLHNKLKIRVPILINVYLSAIILLTLSYSSVVIMLMILFLKLVKSKETLDNLAGKKNTFFIGIAIIAVVIFFFREELYITFVTRTMELITGNESSGYERIVLSWRFVNKDNFLAGIGLMQTPGSIWSIPAYILTELGLLVFLLYLGSLIYILYTNLSIGIVFILLNFAKGGYLSSSFWFLIILVWIYSSKDKKVI